MKRSNLNEPNMPSFESVIDVLREFLWQVVQAAPENGSFGKIWIAGGPWQEVGAFSKEMI